MKHLKLFNESEGLSKVVEVTDECIKFDNGIELCSYHSEDCCESHWIDFSYVNIDDFDNLEFDLSGDSFFNKIPDYGIELVPVSGWGVRIPGYGSNNGYYSDNLSLRLSDGRSYDISDCQEVTGDE